MTRVERHAPTRLLLPGWRRAGPDPDLVPWHRRWQRLHGCVRVEQDDWVWPRRGDWMSRLDEVVQEGVQEGVQAVVQHPAPDLELIAHGLGCHLVAAWAAHSRHTARVRAALLVDAPDLERADLPPNLHTWRPTVRARLPFPSLMVGRRDDPWCACERAAQMARDWGSRWLLEDPLTHAGGDAGRGDWCEAWALLQTLGG